MGNCTSLLLEILRTWHCNTLQSCVQPRILLKPFRSRIPKIIFFSLVNSNFLHYNFSFCYYKCPPKQFNHVYFAILCTSKFSGFLRNFIMIILFIYPFSSLFEKDIIYTFFLIWVLFLLVFHILSYICPLFFSCDGNF